jgi:hypothetical protein
MRAPRRGRLGLAVFIAAAVACLLLSLASRSAAAPTQLPDVHRQGSDLVAGGERFRAWGFNYGIGDRYPILRYFDRPTESRLDEVVSDMREARALGANTLRVYLEVDAFMKGPMQPNRRAFAALAALLDKAERLRIYLNLTGNLVWRAPPAWYDALPEQARWGVQARFWREVARTARSSPAVLVYELTSEPEVADDGDWYSGDMGGYTFIQRIVRKLDGRNPSQLARRWIRMLTASVRAHDRSHLIGIGLLPSGEPFGGANVADLLDVLLVHEYPEQGREAEAIARVHDLAASGKPVILGETAPLWATAESWESFLTGSRNVVDGHLYFYDGRMPGELGPTMPDALHAGALTQFRLLRGSLQAA